MEGLVQEIGEWAEETFKHDASPECLAALCKHICKEANELENAVPDRGWIAAECADILILICSLSHLLDFDLHEAVLAKMNINRNRQWGEPDKDGVIEHRKEGEG